MLIAYFHSADCYPEEACGMLFFNGEVRKANNIQNELHEKDPAIYPRDATKGYTMSVEDNRILSASFKTSNPVTVIYHSHPDVGAYFSQEDRDKALYFGELLYPVSYLVVDVREGTVIGSKLFSISGGEFLCVADYDAVGNFILDAKVG